MATYAIGDVQGCYDELAALVEKIEFDPAHDQLWFVGDLVNRGPKSLEVLRYVRGLGAAAVTVLGNHDLHLLAIAAGHTDRLRDDDTLDNILHASDRDELIHWLRHRPILHDDASLKFAMLHAGLPPQWNLTQAKQCAKELEGALRDESMMRELFAHMYGNQPNQWSDELRGTDRLRFITNCFARLRVCDAQGHLNLKYKGALKDVPRDSYAWFQVPDRKSVSIRIVCGHWSALDYYHADNIFAIDTGCVWGERLCALRLDELQQPVFVKSKQKRSGKHRE